MAKEIEKKFLVIKPDILTLARTYNIKMEHIEQTYLTANTGERRVRRVTTELAGEDDYICHFFYTEKHQLSGDGFVREENEVRISYKEYLKLMSEMDKSLNTIDKSRYTFYIGMQKYELDVYVFENRYAILEVELESEDMTFEWPEAITKIKDVTSDKNFKNKGLAKELKFPNYN